MKAFRDGEGREWLLRVDVDAIRRVRATTGVDLYKLPTERMKPLADLIEDPVKVCDVLFVLCQKQAAERKVSDEDFGRALAGEAYEHAAETLVEAVLDFFPSRRRDTLRRLMEQGRKIQGHLTTKVADEIARIERLTPEELVAELTKNASTNSQGPSGSIPPT